MWHSYIQSSLKYVEKKRPDKQMTILGIQLKVSSYTVSCNWSSNNMFWWKVPVSCTHQIYNLHFIAVRTSGLMELHFASVLSVLLTSHLQQHSSVVKHIWHQHDEMGNSWMNLPFFAHFSRVPQVYPIAHQLLRSQEMFWALDVVVKHQNTSFWACSAVGE